MKTFSDIKHVLYREADEGNDTVKRFLALQGKQIIAYRDEASLGQIINQLKNESVSPKEVIILKEFMGRIFQKCPGSAGMICCNYLLLNTCFDCLFNCSYCFLNSYLNEYGIIQFTNTGVIPGELRKNCTDPEKIYRVGTGEYTDSLMMDEVTGIGRMVIEAASSMKNVMVEMKTKSDNVQHLLDIKKKGSAVLAWSLNTPINIETSEAGTAILERRLAAARNAAESGYYIAFHFDPIIMYDNFLEDYDRVIDLAMKTVDRDRIVWISLGCFRYSHGFKDSIREKFPRERLTIEEMFPGRDGKFRYFKQKRIDIYRHFVEKLHSHGIKAFVYLCMESGDIWEKVFNAHFSGSNDLEDTMGVHLKKNFLL